MGPEAEVRWPNALGAKLDSAVDNHWFDAVVVPVDQTPPADDPRLPHCLWTVADHAQGRVEDTDLAMPCLGVVLDDLTCDLDPGTPDVEVPMFAVLGGVNERAYGQSDTFGPLGL